MKTVIGVDGCPAGWIAVMWDGQPRHQLFLEFKDIVGLDAAIIAVDMPIGLPEKSGRICERDARKGLGARQSSLFMIPSRAAIACEDYREACTTNLLHSDPPKKIAKQTFNLFPKIREIDALMTPNLQSRVYESHPEVAFWMMNGETPVPLPKKVKSRAYEPGLLFRRELLKHNGFPVDALPPHTYRKSDVGKDDILDACACAWVARRIADGRGRHFPADPPRDALGLRMSITV